MVVCTYLFTAVWSPVSPDMVDSYSILISQATPAGRGDITIYNITTDNSSATLELLSNTLYNITIATSYCPGITLDDSSTTFNIGYDLMPCVYLDIVPLKCL